MSHFESRASVFESFDSRKSTVCFLCGSFGSENVTAMLSNPFTSLFSRGPIAISYCGGTLSSARIMTSTLRSSAGALPDPDSPEAKPRPMPVPAEPPPCWMSAEQDRPPRSKTPRSLQRKTF